MAVFNVDAAASGGLEADDPASRPSVALLPGRHRRVEAGHPWVYSNEVRMDAAAKALPLGALVTLRRADESPLGVAMFNPHNLLAARMLDRDAARPIGHRFLSRRLERALRVRQRIFNEPCYRLVHAEADGLPGLVVDRFGPVVAVQSNAAGIARLEPLVLDALDALLQPAAIVLRNDSPVRALEGLALIHSGGARHARLHGSGPRKRRRLPDRPARRPEDRMVLRPARQSAVCRRAGARCASPRLLLLHWRLCGAGGSRRGRAGARGRQLGAGAGARRRSGEAERSRRDLPLSPRRGVCRGRPARRGGRTFRPRHRRSPGLCSIAQGGAGGAAGIPQADAARGGADRDRRHPLHRLVLLQCRRRGFRRSGPARACRCRARRPHPAGRRGRRRPPDPPGIGRRPPTSRR